MSLPNKRDKINLFSAMLNNNFDNKRVQLVLHVTSVNVNVDEGRARNVGRRGDVLLVVGFDPV